MYHYHHLDDLSLIKECHNGDSSLNSMLLDRSCYASIRLHYFEITSLNLKSITKGNQPLVKGELLF